MDGETVKGEERMTFSEGKERYRDIQVGPDGAIYVLTDGPAARLLKVTPKASGASTLAPAVAPPAAPLAAAPPATPVRQCAEPHDAGCCGGDAWRW